MALTSGNDAKALRLSGRATSADPSYGWAHYDRAFALADLGSTDDAMQEFARADHLFMNDPQARTLVAYGRAHALSEAGRCDQAHGAYEKYAALESRLGARPTPPCKDAQAAFDRYIDLMHSLGQPEDFADASNALESERDCVPGKGTMVLGAALTNARPSAHAGNALRSR